MRCAVEAGADGSGPATDPTAAPAEAAEAAATVSERDARVDVVRLQQQQIDVDALQRLVATPAAGAVSMFLGVTRDNFQGRKVLRLEYEAFDAMAEKVMRKILLAARERWPGICKTALVHRLGVVPVMEASVCIVVSSPHRRASLEAVHYIIDEVKALVPVWKKEIYAEDQAEAKWKANSEWDPKRVLGTTGGTAAFGEEQKA